MKEEGRKAGPLATPINSKPIGELPHGIFTRVTQSRKGMMPRVFSTTPDLTGRTKLHPHPEVPIHYVDSALSLLKHT